MKEFKPKENDILPNKVPVDKIILGQVGKPGEVADSTEEQMEIKLKNWLTFKGKLLMDLDYLNLKNKLDKIKSSKPQIGDAIQWTSLGTTMFKEPKIIEGFSDDKKFVFIEGSKAGIPIEQIEVIERAKK